MPNLMLQAGPLGPSKARNRGSAGRHNSRKLGKRKRPLTNIVFYSFWQAGYNKRYFMPIKSLPHGILPLVDRNAKMRGNARDNLEYGALGFRRLQPFWAWVGVPHTPNTAQHSSPQCRLSMLLWQQGETTFIPTLNITILYMRGILV